MPIMDGYEATMKIRKIESVKNIPIIAMTAHAMAEHKRKGLNVGMDDYITKPFDPKDLLSVIAKWILKTKNKKVDSEALLQQHNNEIITDGIDMKAGISRVGGNPKKYNDFLLKFYNNSLKSANELDAAISECEKNNKAILLTHSLRGSASLLGINIFINEGLKLETALLEKKYKNIPELHQQFKDKLDQTLTILKNKYIP